MSTSSPGVRRRTSAGWRGVLLALRRLVLTSQVVAGSIMVLLAVLVGVGVFLVPEWVPPALFVVVLLVGTFALRLPALSALICVITLLYGLLWLSREGVVWGSLLVHALSSAAAMVFVRGRDRLGLQGISSNVMLVDLRDRLSAHGRVPSLPAGWRVDSAIRSAHGEAFSGDFMVAARSGTLLEIMLVDVSGKGQGAGVRSLQLSGAFGGLLGAMPRTEVLQAANAYLLRQDWEEGFATAVHLAVCLSTGEYWASSAGHPPLVHLHAGSGRLEVLDGARGPALGIAPERDYPVRQGRFAPGDVVMMYTDGVVETPGVDLDLGIDRFMGVAGRVVGTRQGGAEAVLRTLGPSDGDDRALVFVHRD